MADLNKPIMPAPANYLVDLENPQRRGEALIVWVGVVGMATATVLLLIRLYTKLVLVKKITSDDCRSPAGQTLVELSNTFHRVSLTRMGE